MTTWTEHALARAKERFHDVDIKIALAGSRRAGKKMKSRIRKLCPVSARVYMKFFAGRYYLVSRCGQIVFVMQAPDLVITVFNIYENNSATAQENQNDKRRGSEAKDV